eukprot:CAMPEP_0116026018 /NCGR_PEP_ID=MMETSP0321-20121206/13520_1 /TAXON_ID=163516 /ORGANISM="Leptocylindrus danicus var. danicus, Strain B650" /LENGTH=124 /DNA_ID=CAMNT_0003498575 /DNA_START=230 /DNA_END=603 /DNA_ORIENTATION=+
MSDRHVLNGKSGNDVDVAIKQIMRKNHRQHQSFKVHSSMTKAPHKKSKVLVPLDAECLNDDGVRPCPKKAADECDGFILSAALRKGCLSDDRDGTSQVSRTCLTQMIITEQRDIPCLATRYESG